MIRDVNMFDSLVFLRYIQNNDNNWLDQQNVLLHSLPYIYFYLKDIFVVIEKRDEEWTYIEHSAHDHTFVYPDCT